MVHLACLAKVTSLVAWFAEVILIEGLLLKPSLPSSQLQVPEVEGKGYAQLQQTPPKAVPATVNCLAEINAIRKDNSNGIPHLKNIVADGNLEEAAQATAVQLAGADKVTCSLVAGALSSKGASSGLVMSFERSKSFQCAVLLQETYSRGLKELQGEYDASYTKFNRGTAPFDTRDTINTAYLMWKGNTRVGCGVTKDCESGYNVLSCKFATELKDGETPFSAQLFSAMVQRSSAILPVPVATALFMSATVLVLLW